MPNQRYWKIDEHHRRLARQARFELPADPDLDARFAELRHLEHEIGTKIPVAKEGGGFIYHSDGSIPLSVTFDTFKFVYQLGLTHGVYG